MTAKNEFPQHSTLPEDDFWGEPTEESRQAWEEWTRPAGERAQKDSDDMQDQLAAEAQPEQVTNVHMAPEQVSSPNFRTRVKRLGSLLLRRTAQHPITPELPAELPPQEKEEVAEKVPIPRRRRPDFDYWAIPEPEQKSEVVEPVSAHEEAETPAHHPFAELFEQQGFVKETPYLDEQVQDTSRTNIFRYDAQQERRIGHQESAAGTSAAIRTLSEHEGLVALKDFLDTASRQDLKGARGVDLSEAAGIISRKLSFIGEKEFSEATQGIKEIWKDYLDTDPENVLHVVAGVSAERGVRKSDQFVAERILDAFSEEELEDYAGRIKLGTRDVTSEPDKTKIVLVDDWTMSGSQLRAATANLFEDPKLDPYRKQIEVNLLAASDFYIRRGLTGIFSARGGVDIPVKAYYQTHDFSPQSASARAIFSQNNETAPLTGVYSSGDFGFDNVIHDIVAAQQANGQTSEMPPLTNIVREYQQKPSPIYVERGVVHKL